MSPHNTPTPIFLCLLALLLAGRTSLPGPVSRPAALPSPLTFTTEKPDARTPPRRPLATPTAPAAREGDHDQQQQRDSLHDNE